MRWTGHVKVDKVCNVEGCGKPSGRRNMCVMHAKRLRIHGDVHFVGQRGGLNASTPQRFWDRIPTADADSCRIFPGARNADGYGLVSYQGASWLAHRLAYTLANGTIPHGLMVLHRCDNPPCCNPSHLYAGDGSQNMRDMYERQRGNRPTGVEHHMNRLDEDAQKAVAAHYWAAKREQERRGLTRAPRGSVQRIAEAYGIDRDTVAAIAMRHRP